eukprot:g52750.t1
MSDYHAFQTQLTPRRAAPSLKFTRIHCKAEPPSCRGDSPAYDHDINIIILYNINHEPVTCPNSALSENSPADSNSEPSVATDDKNIRVKFYLRAQRSH